MRAFRFVRSRGQSVQSILYVYVLEFFHFSATELISIFHSPRCSPRIDELSLSGERRNRETPLSLRLLVRQKQK